MTLLQVIHSFFTRGEITVDASEFDSFMRTAESLEVTSLCSGPKKFILGDDTKETPKNTSTDDSPKTKSNKTDASGSVSSPGW